MDHAQDPLFASKILVVDDEPQFAKVVKRVLNRAGHDNVTTVTDPHEAVRLFQELLPDAVLLDLNMPGLSGYEVLEALGPHLAVAGYPSVLMLTADADEEKRRKCLAHGARDFIQKPFDPIETTLRVRNHLELHALFRDARRQQDILAEKVAARTRGLERAQLEILERLARAAEFRDDDTGDHTRRVGELAESLAKLLDLPAAECATIRIAAPLHDIGKIGIPDAVLLKPGKLTQEEFDQIKTHTTTGARLLAGSDFALLQLAEQIALSHHENWDGSGYPNKLREDGIPLAARLTAIADVYDALTHDRPYKKAWTHEAACNEIESLAGRKFDPRVVRAFLDWASCQVS